MQAADAFCLSPVQPERKAGLVSGRILRAALLGGELCRVDESGVAVPCGYFVPEFSAGEYGVDSQVNVYVLPPAFGKQEPGSVVVFVLKHEFCKLVRCGCLGAHVKSLSVCKIRK